MGVRINTRGKGYGQGWFTCYIKNSVLDVLDW